MELLKNIFDITYPILLCLGLCSVFYNINNIETAFIISFTYLTIIVGNLYE